jgi:hypothetical protein
MEEVIARLLDLGELEDAATPPRKRVFSVIKKKSAKTAENSLPQPPLKSVAPRHPTGMEGMEGKLTLRAREFEPSANGHGPARSWPLGGFDSGEDFETWWGSIVADHPNTNRNAVAKTKALELIVAGKLNRVEFEGGLRALREAAGDQWAKNHGQYAPNLYQLLEDESWRHALRRSTRTSPDDGVLKTEAYISDLKGEHYDEN